MATIKESALAYEPPQTLNIADIEYYEANIELKEDIAKNSEGKDFEVKYIEKNGKKYRVPNSVLAGMKGILMKFPNTSHFTATKMGTGMNTKYQVMPYTPVNVTEEKV